MALGRMTKLSLPPFHTFLWERVPKNTDSKASGGFMRMRMKETLSPV